MNPRYQLTPQAVADLMEIWHYTEAEWGEAQAEKYAAEIERVIERLASGELNGRPCARLVGMSEPALMHWRSGRHYIIHRRMDDEPLQVLTILHSASQERLEEFLGED